MTAIAEVLCAAGYRVFLPHRDGMEFRLVLDVFTRRGRPENEAGRMLHEAIFALDVYQLVAECEAMVWNMNGRTPDEGAVSEAAIAWTLGKPLIGYRDDARSLIAGRNNPLMAGLIEFETIASIEAIPEAMREAIGRAPLSRTSRESLTPQLARAVELGRTLWGTLQQHTTPQSNEAIADAVAELFAPRSELNATSVHRHS